MRVAKYWVKATAAAPSAYCDRTEFRTAWGSSDESEADAAREARARAERAARLAATDQHDPSWYLGYTEGVPEPLVERVDSSAGGLVAGVTINHAGCQVLNCVTPAFIDVDAPRTRRREALPEPGRQRRSVLGRLFGGGGRAAAARAVEPVPEGERAAMVIDYLRAWSVESPGRGARVYQTAGGFRYMILSPRLAPDSEETAALMARLEADRLYAVLCRAQKCFRARLTPKPWRIGMQGGHIGWENFHASSARVDAWLREYAQRSAGYAVCRLIDEVGDAAVRDEDTARVVRLHDEATLREGLPLA